MKTLGIIPARYAASRFPGKPLVKIGDKTMLQRVCEQARQATLLDAVLIATDDERIFDHALQIGAHVMMTNPAHATGTDRCAEVAKQIVDYELVINIQGDEPFINPAQIDQVVSLLQAGAPIATLAKKIGDEKTLFNPNVVKVVLDKQQRALYFSRLPVPYVRDEPEKAWLAAATHYKHIGLYGFRRNILLEISALAQSDLERAESLEQLRWLEHGHAIHVGITEHESIGIDTPADLQKIAATFLR